MHNFLYIDVHLRQRSHFHIFDCTIKLLPELSNDIKHSMFPTMNRAGEDCPFFDECSRDRVDRAVRTTLLYRNLLELFTLTYFETKFKRSIRTNLTIHTYLHPEGVAWCVCGCVKKSPYRFRGPRGILPPSATNRQNSMLQDIIIAMSKIQPDCLHMFAT